MAINKTLLAHLMIVLAAGVGIVAMANDFFIDDEPLTFECENKKKLLVEQSLHKLKIDSGIKNGRYFLRPNKCNSYNRIRIVDETSLAPLQGLIVNVFLRDPVKVKMSGNPAWSTISDIDGFVKIPSRVITASEYWVIVQRTVFFWCCKKLCSKEAVLLVPGHKKTKIVFNKDLDQALLKNTRLVVDPNVTVVPLSRLHVFFKYNKWDIRLSACEVPLEDCRRNDGFYLELPYNYRFHIACRTYSQIAMCDQVFYAAAPPKIEFNIKLNPSVQIYLDPVPPTNGFGFLCIQRDQKEKNVIKKSYSGVVDKGKCQILLPRIDKSKIKKCLIELVAGGKGWRTELLTFKAERLYSSPIVKMKVIPSNCIEVFVNYKGMPINPNNDNFYLFVLPSLSCNLIDYPRKPGLSQYGYMTRESKGFSLNLGLVDTFTCCLFDYIFGEACFFSVAPGMKSIHLNIRKDALSFFPKARTFVIMHKADILKSKGFSLVKVMLFQNKRKIFKELRYETCFCNNDFNALLKPSRWMLSSRGGIGYIVKFELSGFVNKSDIFTGVRSRRGF